MTARDIARTFDVRRALALDSAPRPTDDHVGECGWCFWPAEDLVELDDQVVCPACFLNLTADEGDDTGEVAA